VQFVRAKDVQPVPFEYSNNTIMIEAELAGQHGWMLIDTGAPHTVIDTSLAKELGRTIVPMKGDMLTVGGHAVPRERVDDVALVVPHHFSIRMPMLALDLSSASRSAHRRIVGIIGNDLISHMLLWVMKPQGELILLPGGNVNFTCKGPCTDASIPRPIPIDKVADHEEVVATIGGRALRLKIDTGDAGGIALTREAWERVKPADAQVFTRTSIGASGVVDKVQSSRLPQVSIGATTVEDVRVDVLQLGPSDADGLIGMGVLSRYSFALDTKRGQLWLVPAPSDPSKLPPPVLSKPGEQSPAASHL
jgi:predicted aspartyl protease